MGRLFGTDGARGVANVDLTPELAFDLGYWGALLLTRGKGKIVVGRDTRLSCDLLESALVSGILSAGSDALVTGVIPTAGVAYLTRELEAYGGVMISASHNPSEYNGIKFFDASGFKLSDGKEDEIEKSVKKAKRKRAQGSELGCVRQISDAKERYINFLVGTISGELDGFKIALDCANGASCIVSPKVLRELGATVLVFAAEPDGLNINLNCGSTYPAYVREIVETHDVNIGLTHDGDADRVIAVDERGEIVDGDFVMAICARHLKKLGKLKGNSVVTTVMTNLGFDIAMEKEGINVIKTQVGDRYVLEEMLKKDISLGGEQSGHIIFLEYSTTGDGIITALQLLAAIRDEGKPLSELKKIMKRLPQMLVNVTVKNKDLESKGRILEKVKEAEENLGSSGRILVRASGTEPLVRVMVEAKDKERATSVARDVASVVEEELG